MSRACKQIAAAVVLALLAGCASEKPIDPWTRDKDAVLAAIKANQNQNAALGLQIQELTRQILKLQRSDKKQVSQLTAMEASLQGLREKQQQLIRGHKRHPHRATKGARALSAATPSGKHATIEEKLAKVEHDLDATLKRAAVKHEVPITDPEPGAAPPPPPAPKPAAKPVDPAAEKNSYSAAYLSLKSGRFEDASKQFLAHLKKFPRGSLTDQALYWLGESFLAQQRDEDALKALKQLVSDYPRSSKYGIALLRIASVYEKEERKGDAKAAYLQLIQTQPNSNAAERARARLAALK